MNIQEAIVELRKIPKKKFEQSIDLLVNLKGLDLRKDNISTFATLPHPFQVKTVCGFLTKKNSLIQTVLQPDFARYKDKKELKKLVKNNDFFIAHSTLMPQVATTFGKALGPTGKMPSPQLGVLTKEDDESIKTLLAKINQTVKIRLKEPSFKISVGKEGMKDTELIGNIQAIYDSLVNALPVKRDNVRSVMLKLTMSKPLKVEIK